MRIFLLFIFLFSFSASAERALSLKQALVKSAKDRMTAAENFRVKYASEEAEDERAPASVSEDEEEAEEE